MAATTLSEKDRELIKEWLACGVLQKVEKHRVDQRAGAILITCSDGDRFPDIWKYQCNMQSAQRNDTRIHLFAWHGGSLACVPESPINTISNAHEVFLGQIPAARALKGINTLVHYAHAPCGAAGLYGVDLKQVLGLQMKAHLEIIARNTGIDAFPFFHIDYGEEKYSYFASPKEYPQWVANKAKTSRACA